MVAVSAILAGVGWLLANDMCAFNKEPLTATIEVTKDDDVNSFHHQAVAAPGERFKITARALDGVVEAIESSEHKAVLGVGKWMKVETYLDGVATGDTKTDWSVIGADVIATKNNNVYVWNPKKEYDEVVITIAGVLKAADVQKIYGILLQSDIDGDGVPDCKDDDSLHVRTY